MALKRIRRRLAVEALDPRLAPANFTVTTTQDVASDTDGKLSLREAITAANQRSNSLNPGSAPDVIVLKSGVYKVGIIAPDPMSDNLAGDFDVKESVKIIGKGALVSAIEGNDELDTRERLFEVDAVEITFKNLTLRKGGNAANYGGAIHANNANIRMIGCIVSDNIALGGGGINAPNGDVTLIDCEVSRNVSKSHGGGIDVGGALSLTNSHVRNNVAGNSGGGLSASTASLTNCTISGNSAGLYGGGIRAISATLARCTVSGNRATAGSVGSDPANGGGISASIANLIDCFVRNNLAANAGGGVNADTANLTNCTVSGNTAGSAGGGIFSLNGVANLTKCTVGGNHSLGSGGGVYAKDVNVSNSSVSGNLAESEGGGILAKNVADLANSTISGNYARLDGGGIDSAATKLRGSTVSGNSAGERDGGGIHTASAALTNSTISGNFAAQDGGGVWALRGTFVNVTVVDNCARTGGGVFHDNSAGTGPLIVQNTIVAQNLVRFGVMGPDVFGNFVSLGHNLIGDRSNGTGFHASGDLAGTADAPISPGLGPLKFNGGPTMTHALLAGSLAIDKGDNAAVDPITGQPPTADQRGRKRRKDGDGNGKIVVDIGALER